MGEDNQKNMTILDEMISDDGLQMMKAALPYIAPSGQRFLSIFAKFSELQKTMTLFQNSGADMTIMSQEEYTPQPLEMLNDIRQYATPQMKGTIDNLINTFSMIELFQLYQNNND